MSRLYRLLAPGLSFAALGLFIFADGQWSWFQFRGGLITLGIYAFAAQILLSALLVSAIDDLAGSSPWHLGGRGGGALLRISARPVSFRRALAEFYWRPFWPVLLLAFGLATSLATFAVGMFHEDNPTTADDLFTGAGLNMARSEAVLGTVLVLGAAVVWWRGVSFFGWVIGVCVATAVVELLFVPYVEPSQTVISWGSVMIGTCLFRCLVFGAERAWRALFRPGPATGLSRS